MTLPDSDIYHLPDSYSRQSAEDIEEGIAGVGEACFEEPAS